MEQLGPDFTAFIKYDIEGFFRKFMEKIKLSLKSDDHNGYFR